MGGPHSEVGLKQQLSPRGSVTKEEELKSLLVAVQIAELDLHRQIPKFSVCRTSKWTSAPAAETGLALGPVGFMGTYRGWARPESELPP